MLLERDRKVEPDLVDFQFGISIAIDIENRTGGYLAIALTQWSAMIRKHEREKMLTNQTDK